MLENQQQCQTILKNLQEEINNLINEVHKKLNGASVDLKDDIQYELASQIALLQRFSEYILNIQKHRYKDIAECLTLQSKFNSVKVAMSSLLSPKKEAIILAKNVRYDVEYFINGKKSFGFIKNFFKKATR
jgi:actin-like ATPase involved in cell morphogenesis